MGPGALFLVVAAFGIGYGFGSVLFGVTGGTIRGVLAGAAAFWVLYKMINPK